jgi:hypothetical protein
MRFDPEKSLFELSIVRWTAAATVIVALLLSLVIAFHTKEPFAWDGDSVTHGVDLFKIPLGILAVGLTLIGIYGANHRSEQTRKQILRTAEQIFLTQNQNNFSNYYKHIEEFEKYADLHKSPFEIKTVRALYNQIFPKSRDGEYKVSAGFYTRFSALIDNFIALGGALDGITYNEREKYYAALIEIIDMREEFLDWAHMKDSTTAGTGAQISTSSRFAIIPGGNLRTLFDVTVEMFGALDALLKFDLNYQSPASLVELANIDSAFISNINVTSSVVSFKLDKLRNQSTRKKRRY